MGIPSIKKHIISNLAAATNIPSCDFDKNEIVLVTAYGLITGKLSKLIQDGENFDAQKHFLPELINQMSENYIEKVAAGRSLDGDDGYLILSNAVVSNGSFQYQFGNLVVFFDQIIGVSIRGIED